MSGVDLCSVRWEPSTVTFAESFRLAIRLTAPRFRRPGLRYLFVAAYATFCMGFLGFVLAPYFTWQPEPRNMALLFASWGLLFPIRLVAITAKTRASLRMIGPVTIEVDPLAITRQGQTRTTRETWAGVADVRVTARDIVFLYKAGDLSWFPRRAFEDREHEARFLKIAGMVNDRLWLRPPDR